MEALNKIGRTEWRWVVAAVLVLTALSTLPYIIAWAVAPAGAHFTGLLFNPLDGNSYIAKMRQGWEGSWRFQLPYTPEPHAGAPVYLLYLFLGHLAHWTGLPLILIYHTARVLGGAAMLVATYQLSATITGDVRERRLMCCFAALGAGFGWLAALGGYTTADLWVAEAFPVLILLTNAHFGVSVALMIGIVVCGLRIVDGRRTEGQQGEEPRDKARLAAGWGLILSTVGLGLIQPFGLVTALGAVGFALLGRTVQRRGGGGAAWAWLAGAAVLGAAYPLYAQWAMTQDPVLAVWNAQNVTPSLPWWDWALSYGVVAVLALPGSIRVVRHGSSRERLLLAWIGLTVVGLCFPWSLQRRFSLGLGVPLGLLAGIGWTRTVQPWLRRVLRPRGQMLNRLGPPLAIALSALTPLFLILVTLLAAVRGERLYYLTAGESQALAWLQQHARPDAVVLCAPGTGLFVPAWAGQPVVYGHPFETVDAQRRREQVTAFWSGEMDEAERRSFVEGNQVGYVLVGPRERALAEREQERWVPGELVFETGGVAVYDIGTGEW